MPKPRPNYHPGGIYHIYNRGCNRASIFREPTNYVFVLRNLKLYTRQLKLSLLAYCLMPNHYHFLIRQDGDNPAGMLSQRVFNSYSKAYNKRYHHSGTLFEGPYRVKVVVDDDYLLHLCRYIHANPVKDGLVAAPEDWPYSNYAEWTGQRPGALVDRQFIAQHFPCASGYTGFVLEYLSKRKLPVNVLEYLDEVEAYIRGS